MPATADHRPSNERILHESLLAGDVTAPAEIAEAYLPPLIEYMRTRFPSVDPALVETAADDAILSYLQRPQQYDPEKMSLDRYLRMSARYDLRNQIETRRRWEMASGESRVVELDAPAPEHEIEDTNALSVEAQVGILTSPVWPRLQTLLQDPIDMEIVLLLMEGVRETSEYAAVLGITHLLPEEQAREVKRHKDRLKKQLRRQIPRSELNDHV